MTLDTTKRKQYFNALKVQEPLDYANAAERAQYVENLHQGTDTVDTLFQAIDLQDGQGVYLFTGQNGSGKSTELKRLQYRLANECQPACKVYYMNMAEWLNVNRPVELGSFLIAVVAAWIEQLTQVDTSKGLEQRFLDFLRQTRVDVSGLEVLGKLPGLGVGLKLSLQNEPDFLDHIAKAVQKQRTAFVQQAKSYVQEVIQTVCPAGEKCVLLVDSLEKIRGTGETVAQVYNSVLALFSQHHDALQLPLVHVVYSIPPYVLEQNRQLPAQLGGATAVQLPSIHVFHQKSQTPDTKTIDKVVKLVAKRCPDWHEFFPEYIEKDVVTNDLRKLIEESGGDLRDLMRALQNCLLRLTPEQPVVNEAALDFARSQIRPSQVLPIEHMQWMVRIDNSHQAEINDQEGPLLLERYLNTKHILAYLNGETWYGLHPLIRDFVLSATRTKK